MPGICTLLTDDLLDPGIVSATDVEAAYFTGAGLFQ